MCSHSSRDPLPFVQLKTLDPFFPLLLVKDLSVSDELKMNEFKKAKDRFLRLSNLKESRVVEV